jgi:hypothetical protein
VRAQRRYFGRRQRTPGPHCEVAQQELTFTDAYKAQHVIAEQARHFTNLPFAAFAQHHTRPGALSGLLDQLNPGRRRQFAVQLNPGAPLAQRFLVKRAIKQHSILFFDFKLWMGQVMGQLTIIGKQDQPLTVNIKPPNRKNPRWQIDEIEHRRSLLRIINCGYHTSRLMQ